MRRIIAIAIAALFVASASFAGPANAVARADDCDESLLAGAPAESFHARGDGEVKEPELDEPTESLPENAKGKGSVKFRATIDVWFHVVSADGTRATGNVTQEEIDKQIEIMNKASAGIYGGVNTGFRYRLAGVTRTVNAEWYHAGPGTLAETQMKKALTRGAPQALNYYSTTAGPYLGWAYFPGLPNARMFLDGIVVDWESMYKTSPRYADRYDLGLTAVHEVGHWLGLHHTFNGGCNHFGDYVDDTPPMWTPTSGCPIGKDTCAEPGVDPIHNYMDYSYDSCYFEFTLGQAFRMQDHYLHFRR